MIDKLSGYKTYIVGLAMIIYGLYLMAHGQSEQGNKLIMEGLGLMALRAGVKKSGLE
jgi:hypothetical protein